MKGRWRSLLLNDGRNKLYQTPNLGHCTTSSLAHHTSFTLRAFNSLLFLRISAINMATQALSEIATELDYSPDFFDGIQLRSTYRSLEEASEDMLHQFCDQIDESLPFYGLIRACMERDIPKAAAALFDRGHIVVATAPTRVRTPPVSHLRRSSRTEPFDLVNTHRIVTKLLQYPVSKSRTWESLNNGVESLTLNRYPAAPPSYTDAIAQQPPTETGRARREQRRRPAYTLSANASPSNSTASTANTVNFQSSILKLWNHPESMRIEKININVTTKLMSSNEYSIFIESNGQCIAGGLVGRNFSIGTSMRETSHT